MRAPLPLCGLQCYPITHHLFPCTQPADSFGSLLRNIQGGRIFSFDEIAEMAYTTSGNTKQAAKIYRCSPKILRTIRVGAAHAYLKSEEFIMAEVIRKLEAKPPTFASVSTLWDETSMRLILPALATETSMQSSTWPVMVSGYRNRNRNNLQIQIQTEHSPRTRT